MTPTGWVLRYKDRYKECWQEAGDGYWLGRMMQEVGEVAQIVHDASYPPEVDDPLLHELAQIASIAMNWMEKIHAEYAEKEMDADFVVSQYKLDDK